VKTLADRVESVRTLEIASSQKEVKGYQFFGDIDWLLTTLLVGTKYEWLNEAFK
jgi:hypothetical protein